MVNIAVDRNEMKLNWAEYFFRSFDIHHHVLHFIHPKTSVYLLPCRMMTQWIPLQLPTWTWLKHRVLPPHKQFTGAALPQNLLPCQGSRNVMTLTNSYTKGAAIIIHSSINNSEHRPARPTYLYSLFFSSFFPPPPATALLHTLTSFIHLLFNILFCHSNHKLNINVQLLTRPSHFYSSSWMQLYYCIATL